MATDVSILLPGDPIPSSLIPTTKKALKIGPGLTHIHPSTLLASIPGTLASDPKKNAIWLEYSGGGQRYVPSVGDLVIGTVLKSAGEYYVVSLAPYTPSVVLPHLAFEGATKKTRPKLDTGDLVYARVSSASKQTEAELECVNSNTGKAEGMGPLKGGMVFNVSCAFARRLMMPAKKGGCVVLQAMSEKVAFEVAVGRNGRVWVSAEKVATVVGVGRALTVSNEEGLDEEGQKGLVKRVLKGM
jgi:exosome complex component RRP40